MTKDFFECSRIRHEGRGATERMRGEGKDSFEQTLKSKNLKGKRIFLGLAIFCIKSDTLAHLKKKLRKWKLKVKLWTKASCYGLKKKPKSISELLIPLMWKLRQ